MFDARTATISRQSYGIAMAQCVFGGPTPGIWLECTGCNDSQRIDGSRDHIDEISDSQAAAIFRRHGWTGQGDRMLRAKCPNCSANA